MCEDRKKKSKYACISEFIRGLCVGVQHLILTPIPSSECVEFAKKNTRAVQALKSPH